MELSMIFNFSKGNLPSRIIIRFKPADNAIYCIQKIKFLAGYSINFNKLQKIFIYFIPVTDVKMEIGLFRLYRIKMEIDLLYRN